VRTGAELQALVELLAPAAQTERRYVAYRNPSVNMNSAKIILFYVIISMTLLGCNSSGIIPSDAEDLNSGWHETSIEHGDMSRVFRFYIPESISENAEVVILLHGGTQSMDKLFRPNAGGTQEWQQIAEEEGFLLMVPNGTNNNTGSPTGDNQSWNDCRPQTQGNPDADDAGFIVSMLDWAAGRFAHESITLNLNRVFATGASNGGMMTYRLATEYPDKFIAGGAFIANLPDPTECAEATTPVPMIIVNGTEDPFMLYEGGSIIGGRGEVLSSESTRDYWIEVNQADSSNPIITEFEDLDPDDGSVVICEYYSSASDGADVHYCKVDGGGHTMPSINHPTIGRQNRDV